MVAVVPQVKIRAREHFAYNLSQTNNLSLDQRLRCITMLNPPEKYLELYDSLDMNNIEEGRIAARCIFDYYAVLMTQAGQQHLDIEPSELFDSSLAHRWNVTKSRLESIEDITVPEEFSRTLNNLGSQRNQLSHNPIRGAKTNLIAEAREIASVWTDWFSQAVQEYEAKEGEMSVAETMSRLAREALSYSKVDPNEIEFDDLAERQSELNGRIASKEKQLKAIRSEESGVSRNLVFLLSDAFDLRQERKQIGYDIDERHMEIEEHEYDEHWVDYTNTYHCVVLEPYEYESPMMFFATTSAWREDLELPVQLDHPQTPEEARENVKELSANEEVTITFGFDEDGEPFIKQYPTKHGAY